jgi:hypothetical protein
VTPKQEAAVLRGRKDSQQVNRDWERVGNTIDGVSIREVRHVPRDHGVITEIFRPELVPQEGFEPPTPSLRMTCSTS